MDEHEKITKYERRRKDKSQIATVDKVLDPKTLRILQRLQERGKLTELSGTFSSGKEANIYTAKCSNSLISKFIQTSSDVSTVVQTFVPVVLKIYKTSTMMFKDRTRYIIDEQRFKTFCTSNSRKLIKLWSEKEVRNLKRLGKQGILCPVPLYLKKSILIMSMIGDVTPAPKLKDVLLSEEQWEIAYVKCIQLIKDMYQKARLIHADFSEYNLIYYNDEIYVIDVSQSMDINQENSNSFLVMDLCNCNDFFSKKIKKTRSEVELFEEITTLKVPEYLKVDGKLNKDCFIPTRIIEIANKEDISLFIDDFKNTGLSDDYSANINGNMDKEDEESNESVNAEDHSGFDDVENESYSKESENTAIYDDNSDSSSLHVESNDLQDIIIEDTMDNEAVKNENSAVFHLKTYAELTGNKIDIYVRRLRLKYPDLTKEQEKEINKQRKIIVKQMNKERRVKRALRKTEYKKSNKKKDKNKK